MLFPLPLCSPHDGSAGITQKGWWVSVPQLWNKDVIPKLTISAQSAHELQHCKQKQPRRISVYPSNASLGLSKQHSHEVPKSRRCWERGFQEAFLSYAVIANPSRAASQCQAWHQMIPSWLQLLAGKLRRTSSSSLWTHIPVPITSAQASPHMAPHPICWSQKKQVASPSTNTPKADLLLHGYFLTEGKKQAMLSTFVSLATPNT